MRRSARRVCALAGVFAFALIGAGCASPSAGAPATTPKTGGHPSSSSGSPSPTSPAATGGKATSPFASLAGYIAGRPGKVTAAVYDRNTGHLWVFNPRERMASIVKVEIMATVLKKAQDAGSIPSGSDQSG